MAAQTKLMAADVVIVAVGLSDDDEGEGQVKSPAPALGAGDREEYGLPADDIATLNTVIGLNSNVVVVVEDGSAIDMSPWASSVSAILMAWYPGMQGGNAIADVLFGDVSPSGRLPVSLPASLTDLQTFPGLSLEVTYDRYHGYQRLDKNAGAPAFPFGYGLSYTEFTYDNITVDDATLRATDTATISVSISNTGDRSGVETVQVYGLALESEVDRPVRKLVGFEQVSLVAGETKSVDIEVPLQEIAYYDVNNGWTVEAGRYRFEIGTNVADLPLSVDVVVDVR